MFPSAFPTAACLYYGNILNLNADAEIVLWTVKESR
jgi:hypothetical protein